jgi:hypothetical protein
MNKIYAVETKSIKAVADVLEDIEASSMIWLNLKDSGVRNDILRAAKAVLELIQERADPWGPCMQGCLLMTCTENRKGDKRYREFGLAFSAGRSWHEPFDAFDALDTDDSSRKWAADIGIEKEWNGYSISTYLDALREMHFENNYGTSKVYKQARTIEIFNFTGTSVELGGLGSVAAMFGALPLISGLTPISAD